MDTAEILAPHVEDELAMRLENLEDSTGAQVAVLTIPSLGGAVLEEYATEVFRTWGLGQADVDNGVLLLVARDDRELRIEVGYGLEGVLTDALAGRIIRTEIVPRFRTGDFDAGVLAGIDAILKTVLTGRDYDPVEAGPKEPYIYTPLSRSVWDRIDWVFIGMFVLLGSLPLGLVVRLVRYGFPLGSDATLASGCFGFFPILFVVLVLSDVTGDQGYFFLLPLGPLFFVWLNRYLESHPRYGPRRRTRRRIAKQIAKARSQGKKAVVIDGVTHWVPQHTFSTWSGGGGGSFKSSWSGGSSGSSFSGGGGSSGGGGASGSW